MPSTQFVGSSRETPSSPAAEAALETLRRLASSPFDEAAASEALATVLEVIHLRYGALLRYDSDGQNLTLVCHQGLAAKAVEAIRLIRRGVSGVWDMPLHAVLQRRVYLIERPKENPFVPVLLDEDQGVLTNVAVLPLFAGGSVTGALLLVGSGVRAIHEQDILALREHAKALGSGLRRPPKAPSLPPRPLGQPIAPPAPSVDDARERAALTARLSELESLVESLRRNAEEGASAAEMERRLGEISRERDRLKSENALQEIALRDLRSEHDLLRDQGAAEAERARKVALELARVNEELAATHEGRQRSSQELEQARRGHVEVEARFAALQHQLSDATDQLRSRESARAELGSRLAAGEAEAVEIRKSLLGREEQIAELRGERERLTASLQNAVSRYQAAEGSIAQLREGSEETLRELRAQVDSLEARLQAAERERDQLSAGSEGRAAIIREIERETEKYRIELAREAERRRGAEETAKSVIRDAAAFQAESERIQSERDAAHAEAQRLRAEAQRVDAELEGVRRTSRSDLERLQAIVTSLRTRAEEAERARSALVAEIERLKPELADHRNRETERRAREAQQDEAERQLRAELTDLGQSLQAATESGRSLSRERDALAARASSLQETTANLLREGETIRAELARREQELQRLQAASDARAEEAERLRRELESVRSEARRLEVDLAENRTTLTAEAERAQGFEIEVGELRAELERSQARGSTLTAELERHAQRERELTATSETLQGALAEREQRLRTQESERKNLEERVRDMESALQGASADLAEKAREIDFISVLRATLSKSEDGRRLAEEASARLEAALEAERQATQRARAEIEGEQDNTRQLVGRLDDLERRLRESDEATAEASHRAALLASERAAAEDTARQLAAELGRRTGEVSEISNRLESTERELSERTAAAEESLRRAESLAESSRLAAAEIETLKRQALTAREEVQRRAHEFEVRISEATTRADGVAAELRAAEQERQRLRESLRSLEANHQQATGLQRETAIQLTELEAAVGRGQGEIERLTAALESQRQRATTLEQDLRRIEAESGRWRSVGEKLQQTLDERDREVRALRVPGRPVAAEPPAAPATHAATPPAPARPPEAAKSGPTTKSASVPPRAPAGAVSRMVVVLDDPGPSFNALADLFGRSGFEAQALGNGALPPVTPAFTAVNLLANHGGGLEGLLRSRTDTVLAGSQLALYATRPGSLKGVVFANVECLIRPIEVTDFTNALAALLGTGKRVTIIGEELDSVLKLNGWATAKGCSVSSAGDLKQGNEILDIVKPDLLVFDFSRMGGEGAGLVIKARRTSRLDSLPMLLVLPPGLQSPSSGFFLKRLATLAEETTLDFAPLARRITAVEKA